jgi:hypothetical protein
MKKQHLETDAFFISRKGRKERKEILRSAQNDRRRCRKNKNGVTPAHFCHPERSEGSVSFAPFARDFLFQAFFISRKAR